MFYVYLLPDLLLNYITQSLYIFALHPIQNQYFTLEIDMENAFGALLALRSCTLN